MSSLISQILADYTLLDRPETAAILETVVKRHPWFTLGRYMLLRAGESTSDDQTGARRLYKSLTTQLEAHPFPHILLTDSRSAADNAIYQASLYAAEASTSTTGMLIDNFLERPAERIVPIGGEYDFDTPQEDISLSSVAPDDEIATEILAQIFIAQGHFDRAIEIYYKLSLKYPEKSSYFAGLIEEIQPTNQ